MKNTSRISGITIVLFGIFYFASFLFVSPFVGFEDGDNPATSLEFLRQHSDFYFLSGLVSVFAAILLTIAVLAAVDTVFKTSSSLKIRFFSTFGLFAALLFFAHGILRMNSPGTLLYMESLDRDWGLSAYLAVQMIGTQGLTSAGIFALSIWTIGLSLAGWRSRKLPRLLSIMGILPALPWLMALLGRSGLLPENLWLVYISSIILGIPLWCILIGTALTIRKSNI